MSASSVTSKGQVTIPKEIRLVLGIKTGSKVRFQLAGAAARLTLARTRTATKISDGAGMLKYRGRRVKLAEIDVAKLLRKK